MLDTSRSRPTVSIDVSGDFRKAFASAAVMKFAASSHGRRVSWKRDGVSSSRLQSGLPGTVKDPRGSPFALVAPMLQGSQAFSAELPGRLRTSGIANVASTRPTSFQTDAGMPCRISLRDSPRRSNTRLVPTTSRSVQLALQYTTGSPISVQSFAIIFTSTTTWPFATLSGGSV